MNLNQKIVAAARRDGVFGHLTYSEQQELLRRGVTRYVHTTGRWVLADAGVIAADDLEAELSAAELAEIGGVR